MVNQRNVGFKYRYENCDFFGELVGFRKTNKKLIPGKCRFKNEETINVLNHFRRTGKFPVGFKFPKINNELKTNISFTNNKRKAINSLHSNEVAIGDKCVLNENYLSLNKFKGDFITCDTIIDGKVNGMFKMEHIELGYCVSSHKYQGKTIDEPYNIHEFNHNEF